VNTDSPTTAARAGRSFVERRRHVCRRSIEAAQQRAHAKGKDQTMKTIMRELPVDLTPEEMVLFGQRAARAAKRKEELEAAMKLANEEYKKAMGEAQADITHCNKCLLDGKEWREVECEVRKSYIDKTVEVYRRDTGERVEFRPMNERELQTEIPMESLDTEGNDRRLEVATGARLAALTGDAPTTNRRGRQQAPRTH
jgi:hypothetical protein